jgi:DNA-binding transcriptional MerR regulator
MEQRQKFMSTGQVAQTLGIQHYRLQYLISTGQLEKPSMQIAGNRVWSERDVESARNILNAKTN